MVDPVWTQDAECSSSHLCSPLRAWLVAKNSRDTADKSKAFCILWNTCIRRRRWMCHCWVRVCGSPIHDLRNSFLVWLHAPSSSISGGQNMCNVWEDAISLWSVVLVLGWQILQSHACCFQGALTLSRKGTWWRITPAFPRMGDEGLQPVCSWHCLPDSLPSHRFSRLWYAIWWKRFSDYLQATDPLYKASMQAPLNSRLAYSYLAENFISLSRQRFYTSKCCRQRAHRYGQRQHLA